MSWKLTAVSFKDVQNAMGLFDNPTVLKDYRNYIFEDDQRGFFLAIEIKTGT